MKIPKVNLLIPLIIVGFVAPAIAEIGDKCFRTKPSPAALAAETELVEA